MAATSSDLSKLDAVTHLRERGRAGRVTAGGVFGSARALLLTLLARETPVVAVVADALEAEGLEDDLRALAAALPGDAPRTQVLRPLDAETIDAPEGRVALSERIAALKELPRLGSGAIVLVAAPALLEAMPPKDDVAARAITLSVGGTCDPAQLRGALAEAGFVHVPMVAAPAEVSMRGDIVDLFPLGEESPIRVELFDDRIESIRAFDPETQRSVAQRQSVTLPLIKPGDLAKTRRPTFLGEHLPAEALIVRVDPPLSSDRLEEYAFAFEVDRARVRLAQKFLAEREGIDVVSPKVDGDGAVNVSCLSVEGLGGGIDGLADSLAMLRRNCARITVFTETDGEQRRLKKLLDERSLLGDDVRLRRGRIRTGFQWLEAGSAFLNHLELLGRPRLYRPKPRRPAVPARAINNLLELNDGDYVVHLTHGIARYAGMTRMKREEGEEDYLVLEFDGGTVYYLPAAKIDLVQRYIGAGATAPKLDKIGGRSWARKKARVERALEEMADELLAVQATREIRTRPAYPKDDALVAEFEESFPYPDTPDQKKITREIHQDLDGPKPLDRLVCGDVGFGKTELAVRAVFRVVLGGKQVAFLVPTTLLAEQHFQTILTRFAGFPVNCAVLSRFQGAARQKEVVRGLADGTIDVVVGTHRLLSKDVAFKNIGLVVVDEEQRFGVKAKEALKHLRQVVDVLTLTATPIPRTLHMALVGIRDISALTTPPPLRRPVMTDVRRYDEDLIRRAILHELHRGGQVFFVHNRVQSIPRIAERVAALVPTARVVVAHGQMEERALESATRAFAAGEADVLVSTNIIESGLDLPRANTILIDRPDLFGLADLHQLRGRVGRSERQAYCHLLVPDAPLPRSTEKRLKVVEELSHLGAGYDIAIKDLEIRGAGNLVGGEQSGHIAAVGYDLYVQLLRRAIHRARGEKAPAEPLETDVDLGVDAFLPAEYVPDPGQRMELLRRMGDAEGPDRKAMSDELRDRFGRPPRPARHLLALFALRRSCRRLGVRRLLYRGGPHVLIEVERMDLFTKRSPFAAEELVPMTEAVVHLRLAPDQRTPVKVLELLDRAMNAPVSPAARG